MRNALLSGLLLLAAIGPWGGANAQAYPDHFVRIVSPYAPGGGTDVLARLLAQKLTESLGQSVIVQNKPGGGGVLGTEFVAKSPADGYTILMASPSPIVVAPHLGRPLPYNPLKDLASITEIASSPAVMAVNASSPVRTVKDFIELARSKPGQLAYGSSGNGGTGHLVGALFESRTGTKMIHVPYKSGGEALSALIANDVQVIFTEPISLLPQVKSGRLRAIAVSSSEPMPMFPDTPTVSQTVPNFVAGPWFGLMVPANTPPEIVSRLNRETNKILDMPDVKAVIKRLGAEPVGGPPAKFTALINEESERWGALIRQIGLKAE